MKILFGFILTLLALSIGCQAATADTQKNSIVGVWEVDAVGAPFVPHLFTFHTDGTMLSTNPGNVQLNPSAPRGGTNDSLGMGVWKSKPGDPGTYIGIFCQIHAYADNHKPADKLCVTYKIKVNGDTFLGKALAKQGRTSHEATLIGHSRIKIDNEALAGL